MVDLPLKVHSIVFKLKILLKNTLAMERNKFLSITLLNILWNSTNNYGEMIIKVE